MKLKNYSLFCFRTLWIALIAGSLGRNLALATPYATSLTNDGAGTISFRLNQTTTTNDSIWVISSGGAVTNDLQIPGTVTFDRGLIVTNLGIAPGTFLVRIQHVGTGDITTNSPAVRPILARGISVNTRPASPYFGWVYAAEYTAGTRNRGMFAFSSDLVDILGQGNVAKTGGYNFIGGGSPYHTSVAPDDSVLVTDWTDTQGNVLGFAPDLSAFHYVLKPFDTTGLPAGSDNPVGANN